MYRTLAVLALLPVLSMPALAQGSACAEAGTQVDMNACAMAEWQAMDAELNEAYGGAMRMMEELDAALTEADRGAVAALRDAQRLWIAYRDAACEAEAFTVRGGSMEPMLRFSCLARLTAERTMALRGMQEG